MYPNHEKNLQVFEQQHLRNPTYFLLHSVIKKQHHTFIYEWWKLQPHTLQTLADVRARVVLLLPGRVCGYVVWQRKRWGFCLRVCRPQQDLPLQEGHCAGSHDSEEAGRMSERKKKNVLKTSSCYILQTRIYLIKSEANIFIWLLLLNVGWLFHFSAIQTACSGRLHTIDFKVKFDFTLLKVTFVHNLQHGLIKGYASLHSVITFSFVQILKLQKHVTVARIFLSAI